MGSKSEKIKAAIDKLLKEREKLLKKLKDVPAKDNQRRIKGSIKPPGGYKRTFEVYKNGVLVSTEGVIYKGKIILPEDFKALQDNVNKFNKPILERLEEIDHQKILLDKKYEEEIINEMIGDDEQGKKESKKFNIDSASEEDNSQIDLGDNELNSLVAKIKSNILVWRNAGKEKGIPSLIRNEVSMTILKKYEEKPKAGRSRKTYYNGKTRSSFLTLIYNCLRIEDLIKLPNFINLFTKE